MKNGYCFTCGNKGFLDRACPSCGRAPVKLSMNLDKREDVDGFVKEITLVGIPQQYQGVIWSPDILKDMKPEKEKDYAFKRFVTGLEKVNNIFANGMIPSKSAIIIAPAGYSKMTFAYSCMQRAVDNGFTIAPILDSVEIKRFLTLAGDNPQYKLFKSLSYDDYIMADVLFMTVTKLPAREWAFQAIQELIDRRSRRGLSTFVLSRYQLSEISGKDYSQQFSAIATAFSEDTMKYPAIIRYTETIHED